MSTTGVLDVLSLSPKNNLHWTLNRVSFMRAGATNGLATVVLSAVGLLNGETTFDQSTYESDLQVLLSSSASLAAAKDLVAARGLFHNFDRSQLQKFINYASYGSAFENKPISPAVQPQAFSLPCLSLIHFKMRSNRSLQPSRLIVAVNFGIMKQQELLHELSSWYDGAAAFSIISA